MAGGAAGGAAGSDGADSGTVGGVGAGSTTCGVGCAGSAGTAAFARRVQPPSVLTASWVSARFRPNKASTAVPLSGNFTERLSGILTAVSPGTAGGAAGGTGAGATGPPNRLPGCAGSASVSPFNAWIATESSSSVVPGCGMSSADDFPAASVSGFHKVKESLSRWSSAISSSNLAIFAT